MKKMDLVSGYKGVVGLMFGNENSTSNEDSYVERLLDCISNGKLADDRRNAMAELQSVVAESHAAQMAFGEMGFPVLLGVLRDRGDVEMEIQKILVFEGAFEKIFSIIKEEGGSEGGVVVQDSLELLNNLLRNNASNQVLLRETIGFDSLISILKLRGTTYSFTQQKTINLLSALETISLLLNGGLETDPSSKSNRLTNKTVLVQRNVLDHLLMLGVESQWAPVAVRCAAFQCIGDLIYGHRQNLDVFASKSLGDEREVEPALNSILRIILRTSSMQEFIAADYIFKSFCEQNNDGQKMLASTLIPQPTSMTNARFEEDVNMSFGSMLLHGLAMSEHDGDLETSCRAASVLSHVMKDNIQCKEKVLQINLESSMPSLGSPEPLLHRMQNNDGQKMLASTLIPQPTSMTNARFEEDVNMSFGSMLLHGLAMSEHDGDLETSCRAASVLSHVMKDNIQCKEKVLQINLESSMPSLGSPEPLLHRMVKYLALASSKKGKDGKSTTPRNSYFQPIILKLLVTWLCDCPSAVESFLDSRPHLTYLIELISNGETTVCARGLAAILLGECAIYNKSSESGKDAFAIVDAISQKVGLTSYFLKLDEMQKSFLFSSEKPAQPRKPLTRSNANSMTEMEDTEENEATDINRNDDHPMLASMFDSQFVNFIQKLEAGIRDSIVKIYSQPKNNVSVVPAELEQRKDENDRDYIKRLKIFMEKQCSEIQDLLNRNATLAEDLANMGGGGSSHTDPRPGGGSERVQIETLRRDLHEASQRLEMLKTENTNIQSEASSYKNLAEKMETDLKSLSDAYNSLEEANYQLEMEVRALKSGGATPSLDIEKIKAEAREEAQKESEGELGDLLVCLGQEQTKVEKLSARLLELGEDVDALLEGIGDDTGLADDDDDEEEED
ncbi:Armadillo-like helical (mitochondrion) [Artemisia annua]|uniref:Armadillo-like helical n=1 Tax=Artemisia annua TaxID=35608 RepID=A0A2U1Q9Y4_ARTAN|nr:Armadillo-like helical [Artemisia annua]